MGLCIWYGFFRTNYHRRYNIHVHLTTDINRKFQLAFRIDMNNITQFQFHAFRLLCTRKQTYYIFQILCLSFIPLKIAWDIRSKKRSHSKRNKGKSASWIKRLVTIYHTIYNLFNCAGFWRLLSSTSTISVSPSPSEVVLSCFFVYRR